MGGSWAGPGGEGAEGGREGRAWGGEGGAMTRAWDRSRGQSPEAASTKWRSTDRLGPQNLDEKDPVMGSWEVGGGAGTGRRGARCSGRARGRGRRGWRGAGRGRWRGTSPGGSPRRSAGTTSGISSLTRPRHRSQRLEATHDAIGAEQGLLHRPRLVRPALERVAGANVAARHLERMMTISAMRVLALRTTRSQPGSGSPA